MYFYFRFKFHIRLNFNFSQTKVDLRWENSFHTQSLWPVIFPSAKMLASLAVTLACNWSSRHAPPSPRAMSNVFSASWLIDSSPVLSYDSLAFLRSLFIMIQLLHVLMCLKLLAPFWYIVFSHDLVKFSLLVLFNLFIFVLQFQIVKCACWNLHLILCLFLAPSFFLKFCDVLKVY